MVKEIEIHCRKDNKLVVYGYKIKACNTKQYKEQLDRCGLYMYWLAARGNEIIDIKEVK